MFIAVFLDPLFFRSANRLVCQRIMFFKGGIFDHAKWTRFADSSIDIFLDDSNSKVGYTASHTNRFVVTIS